MFRQSFVFLSEQSNNNISLYLIIRNTLINNIVFSYNLLLPYSVLLNHNIIISFMTNQNKILSSNICLTLIMQSDKLAE